MRGEVLRTNPRAGESVPEQNPVGTGRESGSQQNLLGTGRVP